MVSLIIKYTEALQTVYTGFLLIKSSFFCFSILFLQFSLISFSQYSSSEKGRVKLSHILELSSLTFSYHEKSVISPPSQLFRYKMHQEQSTDWTPMTSSDTFIYQPNMLHCILYSFLRINFSLNKALKWKWSQELKVYICIVSSNVQVYKHFHFSKVCVLCQAVWGLLVLVSRRGISTSVGNVLKFDLRL